MNAVTTTERGALAISEAELLDVLASSLYPGASPSSIKMVLGYCKAASLDPMQKPVHIVPMWDSKAEKMRDVVMPGVGLYRTQAARTGEHVGTDEPVFGPLIDLKFGDTEIQVPEWCRVTVFRLKGGQPRAFTATEYWMENYATASKNSVAPNTMWKKRSRGQIAKCAEAQALRKGFPEVGSQPTAEEMEGKLLDPDYSAPGDTPLASLTPQRKSDAAASNPATVIDGASGEIVPPATSSPAPRPPAPPAPAASAGTINSGQVKYLQQKIAALELPAEAVQSMLARLSIPALDTSMTAEQFDRLKSELLAAA